MLDSIKKHPQAAIGTLIFLLLSSWWLFNQFFLPPGHDSYNTFGQIYGVMAFWAACWGVVTAEKWGGWKSIMGRAILMFSLGLGAQFFGQVAYSYYVYILHIEIPYPSLGDLGYFGSIPLYIYGIYLLAKAAGVKVGLRNFMNQLQALIIPFVMILIAYWLFLRNYEFGDTSWLVVLLDFGYPLGEAIYISIAILAYVLSRNVLGGVMKKRILFILVALSVQFLADYLFLFQVKNETWYVGGISDYLYLLAYFLMTLSLLQLNTVFARLRET